MKQLTKAEVTHRHEVEIKLVLPFEIVGENVKIRGCDVQKKKRKKRG